MGRKPKLYVPLVVGFLDDDRIAVAGDGPTLLFVAMLLKAKALGTDGRLTEVQIGRLNRAKWRRELATLADLGLVLWDDLTGDWFIAGWFSHNDAVSVIEERRAVDRKRKADSARNPNGKVPDSLLVVEKSREERSEGIHAFSDDGLGRCATCAMPQPNRKHLRVVS